MAKEVSIWKPIEFRQNWLETDTSKFDDLYPSWKSKRSEFQKEKEYEEFINRLKRQHAIETGVIEKIYDISDGITETFIKEGFIESIVGHDDTNIQVGTLMGFLSDHYEAIDFIFDFVKENRSLSISFIKELHQLITRNQKTTTAKDQLDRKVEIPLLKGEFKKNENNPKRSDGTKYFYCPPIHVDAEMEKLVNIYNGLLDNNINPIVLSAWLHHAFTQIHPFQDGNGRIARLLASLVLIKFDLFPLTVKRTEKLEYIKALEEADSGNPNPLVMFFSDIQKRNIEAIFNFKNDYVSDDIIEVAQVFTNKVRRLKFTQEQERKKLLQKKRDEIFNCIFNLLGNIKNELTRIITIEQAFINITSVKPTDTNYFWFTKQIIDYANNHKYYFNKILPRGWFKLSFDIETNTKYDLIITLHHYGYDDSVVAIGSFLEFDNESLSDQVGHTDKKTTIPIEIAPYTISLESNSSKLHKNIENYIRDVVKVGLSIITNEII
jgi:hypothetical protein